MISDMDRVASLATNLPGAQFQSLAVLLVLIDSAGRYVTWSALEGRVRDIIGYTPGDRSVNGALKRLRAQLLAAKMPVRIVTQRCVGIMLDAPPAWCQAMLGSGCPRSIRTILAA